MMLRSMACASALVALSSATACQSSSTPAASTVASDASQQADTGTPADMTQSADTSQATDASQAADTGQTADAVQPADDTGKVDSNTSGGEACPPAAQLLDVGKGKGAGAGYESAALTGTCTADTFTVKSNGLPFYTYVAMTPNALKVVQQSWTIPRAPKIADKTTEVPLLGPAGFTVAGLPFYGPNEGTQPANEIYGDPVYNGLMDGCMGHTSPQEYHNHALKVQCLTPAALAVAEPWTLAAETGKQASPLIGWALDGFPVYGPYGCLDKACKQVAELKSGYVKTGDPKTYAWKAYTYTAKPDDATVLDACNGRIEPDGSYAYHATANFPYIIGCYKGTPTSTGGGTGGGGTGGGGTGGGGGTDPGGGGPTTCGSDADCTGKCPAGSAGCGCSDTPMGKVCVPTCKSDADCGTTPSGLKTTCKQGFCRP